MNRNDLRSSILSKKQQLNKKIVEWEGSKFEVRQPSVKARNDLYRKCLDEDGNMDMTAFLVWGAILHTYVPDSEEKVFEDTDYDVLAEMPAGGFLDALSEAVSEVISSPKKSTKN